MQGEIPAHKHPTEAGQSAARRSNVGDQSTKALSTGRVSLARREPEHGQHTAMSREPGPRLHSSHETISDQHRVRETNIKYEEGSQNRPSANGKASARLSREDVTLKSAMKQPKLQPVDANIPSSGLETSSDSQSRNQASPGKRKALQPATLNAPHTKSKKLNTKLQRTRGNTQPEIRDFLAHSGRNITREIEKQLGTATSTSGYISTDPRVATSIGQSRKADLDDRGLRRSPASNEEDVRGKVEECPTASTAVNQHLDHKDRSIQPSDSEYDDFFDCEFSTAELDKIEEEARIKKELENNLSETAPGVDHWKASSAPDENLELPPGPSRFIAHGPDRDVSIQGNEVINGSDDIETGMTNQLPLPTKKIKVSRSHGTLGEILEAPPKPRGTAIHDPDVPNLLVQPNGTLVIESSHDLAMNLWRLLESLSARSKRIAHPTGTEGEIAGLQDLDLVKVIELHSFPDSYTTHLLAYFTSATAPFRKGFRLLFPKAKSVTIANRGRVELVIFAKSDEDNRLDQHIRNLAYLADPTGLCFDYNISTLGTPGVGHLMQRLRAAWPRLRRVSIHQALDELPFILPNLKHQVHYVTRAFPFTSAGHWMPPAPPGTDIDELEKETTELFSDLGLDPPDKRGKTAYDTWFEDMAMVLEYAARKSEAADGELPKYEIILPGHDNDIIERVEAGWDKYKAEHETKPERKFNISRVKLEYREEQEVRCGICDFTM